MSKSLPNAYASACRSPHHIIIRLRDRHCQTLKSSVMKGFVFVDSTGREHPLNFRRDEAFILDVPCGVGTLRYTGPLETIADACGFEINEDGVEKDAPNPGEQCSPPEKAYAFVAEYRTHHATYKKLHAGIALEVVPSSLYIQHTVLVDTNRIDWIVLMAFMDNHSGGFHGSGHFGCMIVDGRRKKGRYADFGKYHMILKDGTAVEGGTNKEHVEYRDFKKEEFDMVRVGEEDDVIFGPDGKFSDTLGNMWSSFNETYGSMIMHHKKCTAIGLKGPAHKMTVEFTDENTAIRSARIPYAVNGINAWAAIPLRAGAYAKMSEYIKASESFAEKKWRKAVDEYKSAAIYIEDSEWNGETICSDELVAEYNPAASEREDDDIKGNDYSVFSFNCMTFCLCVHEKGLNPNSTLKANLDDKPKGCIGIDHPNADIMYWMGAAKDKGFFNDRLFHGHSEAVTGRDQDAEKLLRHAQPELVGFP